ncbi:site-specific DNA-methyltransferase [Methylobacterium sp. J-030]|uniref:site-specific DNA-methyltransferase n=1 Tax=Methylobacterium sp. J-030 TaxID=2836627 RepID=UPI001FB87EAE|nr:DNA methyltransferase [Methylobacterium sp. J-030]MCJ2073121.1 site-specific DNA-methyltransferase [Methylobacterium sp. J-030]
MTRRENIPIPSKTGLPPSPANAIALDEAPRVAVGPGLEGRYGLAPLRMLTENPHRVQVHSTRQVSKLSRGIEVTGQLAPAIIDEHYVILAGHARLAAAKSLGCASMPVVQVFNLTEAQKRTFLLSDNRIGLDARLDRKALADQVPELTLLFEEAGLTLNDTGFEIAELDALVIDFEDDGGEVDDTLDPALATSETQLRRGDIFALGAHRLAIGDARDPDLLDRLMAGEKAEAAFVDPPYNLPVRSIGGRGQARHAEFAFASGEMSRAEFVAFLEAALGNAARVSKPGAVHFVSIDWKHIRDLIEAGERVYGAFLNLVTWVKTNAGQGGLYRSQHEMIGVFRVGQEPHRDNVQMGRFGRNRTNVWTYAGANGFRAGRLDDIADHPTVKPLTLVADALKDVSGRDAIVLDTFVGSGTTILAGERIGRRVRAIEYEPRYAHVAIRRFEAASGRDAVHIETGLSLAQLMERRSREEQQSAKVERASARPSGMTGRTPVRARERSRSPTS